MNKTPVIVLLSGGIDSTTVLAQLWAAGLTEITCMVFDYGQTLARELEVAMENAARYGAYRTLVIDAPLVWIGGGVSILGHGPIAKGRTLHEISDSIPTSYVPFRNGIFLSYAVAYGEANGIQEIYAGCNGLNSGNYPDDTEDFRQAFENAAARGTKWDYRPSIQFPFARISKSRIVQWGLALGVNYSKTWSCYENGPRHCGECDSCGQRLAAFAPHDLDLDGRYVAAVPFDLSGKLE